MDPTLISNAYIQGGSTLIIIICFISLLVYVIRSTGERENRLYKIIDVLSEKLEVLPHIKEELEQIKEEIRRK